MDCIFEKNRLAPDIISLNTKDKYARPPTGAPVSDNYSSIDSLLGHLPTQSKGDYLSDNAGNELHHSPYPSYNIPSSPHPSPPNTSKERYISREVNQAEPKRKYQPK